MPTIVIKITATFFVLLVTLFALTSHSAEHSKVSRVKTLMITFDKFKNLSGVLHYQLLLCPQNDTLWEALLVKASGKIPVTQASISLHIDDLVVSKYIVRTFQDLNDNAELDYYASGAPKEPTGFSNNPNLMLGMPRPLEVCFDLASQQTLNIKINNKRRRAKRKKH